MSPTGNSNIIIHPQAENYRRQNRRLQAEIARLIAERDMLQQTVVPHIQAEYQIKIGALEWRVFQMDCACAAMLRRIEMAQAILNRGDAPCYKYIEQEIETEFTAWREKIEKQAREIKEAKRRLSCPTLSRAESRELQTLYRRLAFLLHPDIIGANCERRQKLWLQAAASYRNGDLATLRALRLIVEDESGTIEALADEKGLSVLEVLRNRQTELKKTCEKLLDEIKEIKTTAPYIWLEILDDDEAVAKRQSELREQISVLREKRLQLTTLWAEIMRFAKDREQVQIPPEPPDIFVEEDWAEIIYEQ